MDYIKIILNSDAGLNDNREIIDNRFNLLLDNINGYQNKDDDFYTELVRIFGYYIDKLYDRLVYYRDRIVLNKDGSILSQDYDYTDPFNISYLSNANRELSLKLFDYVCDILENNKNIIVNYETLKHLLNRCPRLFNFAVEESYIYRPFNFNRLVTIINENQLFAKANITLDQIYNLLISTYQLDNSEVVTSLLKKDDFQKNHQKLDELLLKCDTKSFARISSLIVDKYDDAFDRLSILKKRSEDNFAEKVIIELMTYYPLENDINFVHQILNDNEIKLDYNYYYASYIGQSNLKSILAHSENRIIIKDLLSKEENIQECYYHGDFKKQLFILYAIAGNYDKALSEFVKNYNFINDFDEYNDELNKKGYTFADITYRDSFLMFFESIVRSLNQDEVEYESKKELLISILNNYNVKYINFEKILTILEGTLTSEDFKILITSLLAKHDAGNLSFITLNENDNDYSICKYYKINIISEEEIKKILSTSNYENDSQKLLKQVPNKMHQ